MSWDDLPSGHRVKKSNTGEFGDADANNEDRNNGGACFGCGEVGHTKSECPNGGGNNGACFNCGQEGHKKSECTNPKVAREFTGICRTCGKEGHRSAECPEAPPKTCGNCGEEGHEAFGCKNRRLIDRKHIDDIRPETAWEEIKIAAAKHDMDDFKDALQKYVKGLPTITYTELEQAFRNQNVNVYLIALEREMAVTYTNMDFQGNLDKKYSVTYRFSNKPKRPMEAEGWPNSAEENIERLKDAGEPVDRGVSKCHNCDQLGHSQKNCPEEKMEAVDRVEVKCINCQVVGHRVRDCPEPRQDKFACRNCKQSGHSSKDCPEPRSTEGVECRKCHQTGHFSRDCPTGGGGDSACRNCGQEGHRAKDCTEERVVICRNCDEKGHISKECPKPRDYSRVKCSNCQKMGHTKVRCKEPIVEGDMELGNDSANNAFEPAPAYNDDFGNVAPVGDASGDW